MLLHQIAKLADKLEEKIREIPSEGYSPLRTGRFREGDLVFTIPCKSALWFAVFELLCEATGREFDDVRYWVED